MLERIPRRTKTPAETPPAEGMPDGLQMSRRELLIGGLATLVATQLPGRSLENQDSDTPHAPSTSPQEPAFMSAEQVEEEAQQHHKAELSWRSRLVIGEQMASFAQIIKNGHFTPYTSARSIANLYATTSWLKHTGNEADKHVAEEMKLEFTGTNNLNLGLAVALPYITNMTKYMRVVAGDLVTGLPAEQEDEVSEEKREGHNRSWVREFLQPHDITREDQNGINTLFAPVQEGEPNNSERPDIKISTITAPAIDELIHRLRQEDGFADTSKEAMTLIERVMENKLKQLIGRGSALIDVVAPLGTTYLSTQIGNELATEVFEYKYRLEYVREIKRHREHLAELATESAFEHDPTVDVAAPPSHLQEGLHVLEHKALCAADETVNSIRGLMGARIARASNGSGIMVAGDPPLPFAYAEASKRGILPKLVAKTIQWGAVDTVSNGLLTSVQLAQRIIGPGDEDEGRVDSDDLMGTTHAYVSGATIMTNKVINALRDMRPTLRKVNNGTAVKLDAVCKKADEWGSDDDITAQDYTRLVQEFVTDLQEETNPHVVMPILKIMRQSAIGGYHSITKAIEANAKMIGTEEGRKDFFKRYIKLEQPPHEGHHQAPDDLILQGEPVAYDEMASRLESWEPKDQLRYMRSVMFRYLTPDDFAEGSALGAIFADDILSSQPQITGYMSNVYDTAAEFVRMLRGQNDTEDTPITARNIAPQAKDIFNRFAASESVAQYLEERPPLAQDKLADMARSQAGYDLPYGELREWSENAQEVFFALTTQLPHVGAIVETAKIMLESFDKALNKAGADAKTKAALKLTLNSMLVMGVSSVADNVAAFLFGLKTGELIVDDLIAEDDTLTEEHADELKFTAMMTALNTAIHAGQNLLPGNGPNFSAARSVPDVGKLVAIGDEAARINNLDQTADSLPLIKPTSATEEETAHMEAAKESMRTRKDQGFPHAVRIHKVEGWTAEEYREMLAYYDLHMSPERIERFIMNHPSSDIILVPRPSRLEDGRANTHPESMSIKESVQTTRSYPIQGLGAPAVWLGHIMNEVRAA